MKRFLRNRKRFALLSAAALIALSLSGCGLVFVPETESRASVSSSRQNDSSSSPDVSSGAAASSSVPEVAASSLPEIPASSELPEGSASEEPSGFTVDYSRTPDCLRKAASDALIADAHSVVEACLSCQTSARVSCSREDAGLVLYLADTLSFQPSRTSRKKAGRRAPFPGNSTLIRLSFPVSVRNLSSRPRTISNRSLTAVITKPSVLSCCTMLIPRRLSTISKSFPVPLKLIQRQSSTASTPPMPVSWITPVSVTIWPGA